VNSAARQGIRRIPSRTGREPTGRQPEIERSFNEILDLPLIEHPAGIGNAVTWREIPGCSMPERHNTGPPPGWPDPEVPFLYSGVFPPIPRHVVLVVLDLQQACLAQVLLLPVVLSPRDDAVQRLIQACRGFQPSLVFAFEQSSLR